MWGVKLRIFHRIFKPIVPDKIDTTITIRTQKLYEEMKPFKIRNTTDFILNIFLSLMAIISAVIGLQQNEKNIFTYWLYVVIFVVLILLIYRIVDEIKTPSTDVFTTRLIRSMYDVEEYTAIFIIKMEENGQTKILVTQKDGWNGAYLLPWCHYTQQEAHDKELNGILRMRIAEQLSIKESDIELVNPYDPDHFTSIKQLPREKSNAKIEYKFRGVRFKNPYFSMIKGGINQNYVWRSWNQITTDQGTKLYNQDILEIMSKRSMLSITPNASPILIENIKPKRIIWNITNECYYDCPICATNSSSSTRCSTNLNDKQKILYSIATLNGYIESLDFSGGDPLKNKDDREIIKLAKRLLPFTKISISTTGQGLSELIVKDCVELIENCEITYDIPIDEYSTSKHRSYRDSTYNQDNLKMIHSLRDKGVRINLTINVPTYDFFRDVEYLKSLLKDISKMKPDSVKFIRMMQVGGNCDQILDKHWEHLDEIIESAKQIKAKEKYDFEIISNCSLRAKKDGYCPMFDQKLGINHEGKLFSCIWGCYLKTSCGENQFYLGDLCKKELYEIIVDYSTMKKIDALKQKLNTDCPVCEISNKIL